MGPFDLLSAGTAHGNLNGAFDQGHDELAFVFGRPAHIILGIGGDSSDSGDGTFYEGVMTAGYPSDATDQLVQANVVAAKYGVQGLSLTLAVRNLALLTRYSGPDPETRERTQKRYDARLIHEYMGTMRSRRMMSTNKIFKSAGETAHTTCNAEK